MAQVTGYILASSLDAHQYGGGGTVDPTGNVLNASAANQYIGLSFTNWNDLALIKGKTITSAWLEMYFTSGSLDDPDVTIYGFKADYYWNFDTTNNGISALLSTTATVNWTASNLGTGWKQSPDITTVIQELANRPGFAGTFSIICKGNSGSSAMRVRSYDGDSSQAPRVVINYEADGQPAIARGRLVPGMRRPHGSQGW